MNPNARPALGLGITLVLTCAALAQGATGDGAAVPAPQVRSANGVEYLNGGAGEEARAAIDAQRGAFPLRLVFSVASGAYLVADRVAISGARGEVLAVDRAGPMLLVKVPPGDYTIEASVGARSERKRVRVGPSGTTVQWRWPEEAKR